MKTEDFAQVNKRRNELSKYQVTIWFCKKYMRQFRSHFSFDDEGMGAVSKDIGLLTAGFSIVLVYVTFTIGSYSMIHHKVF